MARCVWRGFSGMVGNSFVITSYNSACRDSFIYSVRRICQNPHLSPFPYLFISGVISILSRQGDLFEDQVSTRKNLYSSRSLLSYHCSGSWFSVRKVCADRWMRRYFGLFLRFCYCGPQISESCSPDQYFNLGRKDIFPEQAIRIGAFSLSYDSKNTQERTS